MVRAPLWSCVLALNVGVACAMDYFASPNPTGTDKSLTDCLSSLDTDDRCLLRSGHYYPPSGPVRLTNSENIALEALDPGAGEVIIDGTEELTNLVWKTCAQEDSSLVCADDDNIYVADIGTKEFFQLFYGGDDVHAREMMLPARWPNMGDSHTLTKASDAPWWAAAFDSHASWSFPDGDSSGRVENQDDTLDTSKRVPGKYGKFVDAGGTTVSEEVEVEEGQYETIERTGPGFLSETGFSVEGTNIVITYGKGAVEVGKVTSHAAGSNTFQFEHPECSTDGYGSCSKGFWKTAFVSYYFENALALLDREGEYFFEHREGSTNRLFLKMPHSQSPSGIRFWARHSDFFFTFEKIDSFTVANLTMFATSFSSLKSGSNNNLNLADNTFLYATAGQRILGNYGITSSMYFHNMHGGNILRNTWRYAEGIAFDMRGDDVTMEDNLLEYNGAVCIDGPNTVKWNGERGSIQHNTLRWNGQVSAFKFMGEKLVVQLNKFEYNSWGQSLHDGASIHVQMTAQDSEFSYNWVSNGIGSLGIRFDTAKDTEFTTPESVGHDGQVHHNVLWGSDSKCAIKGERHNIYDNTLFDGAGIELIRAFGVQQGMNALTEVTKNLLTSDVAVRGKMWSGRRRSQNKNWENTPDDESNEKKAKGEPWTLPSGVDSNKVDTNLCSDGDVTVRDCSNYDFRARTSSSDGYGAYPMDLDIYWIPGHRSNTASNPLPANGASQVQKDGAALMFLPAKGCASHKITLIRKNDESQSVKELFDSKNVWDLPALEAGEEYDWTVEAHPSSTTCTGVTAMTFSFTVASTTTTTTGTCVDEENWCASKVAEKPTRCERSNYQKKCKLSCGFCTTTTTNDPNCFDEEQWCASKVAEKPTRCERDNYRKKCKKSCNLCGSSFFVQINPSADVTWERTGKRQESFLSQKYMRRVTAVNTDAEASWF